MYRKWCEVERIGSVREKMVTLLDELITCMSTKEPCIIFISLPACLSFLITFVRKLGAPTLRRFTSLNQPRRSLCKTVTSN